MSYHNSNDYSYSNAKLKLVARRPLNDASRRRQSQYQQMILPRDRRDNRVFSRQHHERPERIRYDYRQLMRLRTLAETRRAHVCVRQAVLLVAEQRNLPSDFWETRRRFSVLVRGRQIVLYLAHIVAQVSMRQLSALTGLDRKTIRYGLGRIEDGREADAFDAEVEDLCHRYLESLKHFSDELPTSDSRLV